MNQITEEAFIEHCRFVLNRKGYHGVNPAAQREATGVDLLARKNGRRYAVRCVMSDEPVGPQTVQMISLNKTAYRCPFSMVMTNAEFDADAKETAKNLEVELMEKVPLQRSHADKRITTLIFLVIIAAALIYCITHLF